MIASFRLLPSYSGRMPNSPSPVIARIAAIAVTGATAVTAAIAHQVRGAVIIRLHLRPRRLVFTPRHPHQRRGLPRARAPSSSTGPQIPAAALLQPMSRKTAMLSCSAEYSEVSPPLDITMDHSTGTWAHSRVPRSANCKQIMGLSNQERLLPRCSMFLGSRSERPQESERRIPHRPQSSRPSHCWRGQ